MKLEIHNLIGVLGKKSLANFWIFLQAGIEKAEKNM